MFYPFTGALSGRWGSELTLRILSLSAPQKVNCILLADVLYHVEDFTTLLETIKECLEVGSGQLVLVYEQRRRDLTEIVHEFVQLFYKCECYKYTVCNEESEGRSVDFFIYHMTQFKGPALSVENACKVN